MQELLHSLYGNFCRILIRETEHAGGDAAERDAFQPGFCGLRQAGAVAGGQQGAVPCSDVPGHDGPHRVQNIPAGQVESRGEFGLPGGLLVALLRHQAGTGAAQLYPGKGMDAVVDAAVAGHIAAGHAAVGGVDDGVALQRGDVALPQVKGGFPAAGGGGQAFKDGNALLGKLGAQVFVLHLQKLRAGIPGRAHIEQCAQQLLLPGGIVRDGQLPVFGGFCQQAAEQKTAAFGLGHRKTSFAVPNGKTP